MEQISWLKRLVLNRELQIDDYTHESLDLDPRIEISDIFFENSDLQNQDSDNKEHLMYQNLSRNNISKNSNSTHNEKEEHEHYYGVFRLIDKDLCNNDMLIFAGVVFGSLIVLTIISLKWQLYWRKVNNKAECKTEDENHHVVIHPKKHGFTFRI